MSEAVFKNIQVLKGIPVDEFMGTMGVFTTSLSLCCGNCHTGAGTSNPKWEDDPPRKRTARAMVPMVQNINKTNFGGRQVVTCWTCHRGQSEPRGHAAARLRLRRGRRRRRRTSWRATRTRRRRSIRSSPGSSRPQAGRHASTRSRAIRPKARACCSARSARATRRKSTRKPTATSRRSSTSRKATSSAPTTARPRGGSCR